ncbi:hypothetical protein F4809DRAFT_622150 [Biscogniauxia mediterranea]|nr:hypothetical protein F4809DRAFT_622150 [Biscogniauxia mediterranea]
MAMIDQLEPSPQREDLKATLLFHQPKAARSSGDTERAIRLIEEGYQLRLAQIPLNPAMLCVTASVVDACYSAECYVTYLYSMYLFDSIKPAEHARSLFKLSEALLKEGCPDRTAEARELRKEAETYLRRWEPRRRWLWHRRGVR